MHSRALILICLTAVVTVTACSDTTGPNTPIDTRVGHGTQLSPELEIVETAPILSPDGRSAYYGWYTCCAGKRVQVSRVALDGSGEDTLDVAGASVEDFTNARILSFVAPAPTGDVYVLARTDTTGLGVLHLSDSAPPAWLPGITTQPAGIGLAPGGQRLVYWDNISLDPPYLRAYDLVARASTQLVSGGPLALSPDGEELLYVTDGASGPVYGVVSLATGQTRDVDLRLGTDGIDRAAWRADGIHVLSARAQAMGGYDYYTHDVTTGATTMVYHEAFADLFASRTADWSADGRKLALAIGTCLDASPKLFECHDPHMALYVVDLAQGTETWVAGARTSTYALGVFTPDGSQLVYSLDGVLYVSPVP